MKELKAGPVLVEPDYLSHATMHAGSLRRITQCEGTYAVGIERVKRRKDPEPLDPTPAHICA